MTFWESAALWEGRFWGAEKDPSIITTKTGVIGPYPRAIVYKIFTNLDERNVMNTKTLFDPLVVRINIL